jgi:hypothetical protein
LDEALQLVVAGLRLALSRVLLAQVRSELDAQLVVIRRLYRLAAFTVEHAHWEPPSTML